MTLVRDKQRAEMASGFGPQKSKHFLSSISEVAVTSDEILPFIDNLRARVLINGCEVATTSTAGMRYSLVKCWLMFLRKNIYLRVNYLAQAPYPAGVVWKMAIG
jgi:2-keto-4-pentenoate hydratase/2-oxohepta-3-ene-1,7-dioic acid hydratase in catechol pathway